MSAGKANIYDRLEPILCSPAEEEDTTMPVNRVDNRELLGLAIERVHLGVTETEASHFESRSGGFRGSMSDVEEKKATTQDVRRTGAGEGLAQDGSGNTLETYTYICMCL